MANLYAFFTGKNEFWDRHLARMMSMICDPLELSTLLASSMVSPRKLFPFTLMISSPSRKRPSLQLRHEGVK
jgi:hypothetical protein